MDNKEKEDILQRYYSKDNNPAAYSGSQKLYSEKKRNFQEYLRSLT